MKRNSIILALIVWLGLGLATARSQDSDEPLSGSDQAAAENSFQSALEYNPSGTASAWQNPDDGHGGETLPTRTFQTANGVYCREFQQIIIVAGQEQQGYGTACRQSDGSWRIVDPRTLVQAEQPPVPVTQVQVYEPRYYAPGPYVYPYGFFPGTLSLSFGFVEHRGHSHFYSDRYRHSVPRHGKGGHYDRHDSRAWGGWRGHR